MCCKVSQCSSDEARLIDEVCDSGCDVLIDFPKVQPATIVLHGTKYNIIVRKTSARLGIALASLYVADRDFTYMAAPTESSRGLGVTSFECGDSPYKKSWLCGKMDIWEDLFSCGFGAQLSSIL